jgi:hypothetical protein
LLSIYQVKPSLEVLLESKFPDIHGFQVDYNYVTSMQRGRPCWDALLIPEHSPVCKWWFGSRCFVYHTKGIEDIDCYGKKYIDYSHEMNMLVYYASESVKYMKDKSNQDNVWYDIIMKWEK